jgi:hypothetical protein
VDGGRGFELEEPRLTIPWGIQPAALRILFHEAELKSELRCVTEGYYVALCTVLGGLKTMLGFHFRPQSETGVLVELEFYENGANDLEASFALYQRHLEQTFGPPSRTKAGLLSPNLPTCEWHRGRIRVSHWVMERFGPEEHVRIVRRGGLARLLT